MKLNTPLITLLTGAALGIILLGVNMVTYPHPAKAPTSFSAPATSAPAASTATSSSPTASPAGAASSPTASPAATSASATSSAASPTSAPAAPASVPAKANYAAKVHGGGASVAVVIRAKKVIAYVCNGKTVAGWFQGTVSGKKLTLTGKNNAHLSLTFNSSGAMSGNISVHRTQYQVSLPMVHNHAGLYRATAMVHGSMVKAGWIVLSDGSQIGSIEIDPDAAVPSVVAAPLLDVAAGTAEYNGVVLHATQISGITGSGF